MKTLKGAISLIPLTAPYGAIRAKVVAINVLTTVSPWVKLYKQFCGPDASGEYSADFLTLEKFTDLFPDYFKSTCRTISFDTNLLKKTIDRPLILKMDSTTSKELIINVEADSDWAGDRTDRKS